MGAGRGRSRGAPPPRGRILPPFAHPALGTPPSPASTVGAQRSASRPPLLGTAPRTPPRPPTPYLLPLLALPQRDEPGQQHGQHAGGSAPHIGGERGVRGPPDGGTERFGLTDFCSHPARRRGNSGGAAGPGQAPAGGARGAVSLTVCAPWGGHCAAGGAPRFFGFFFFSSLYFDLLCFGLLGGVSVCFLISFFYFFMLGWGGCWGLLAVPPLLGSRVWPAGCNMSTWGLKSWLIQWDLKAPPWQGAPGQGDTLLPSLGRDGGVQGPKHSISILQEFGWALWGDPTVPPL